ncbi:glycosyltransferase family 2 protein [Caballeronia sp. LjRoot31]|uniref:glycosyltransferase family 2 protein n=1 Tax=Caballeronia sp. LjRoot31 TaxID=3342324 RepID=UPI003ECE7E63
MRQTKISICLPTCNRPELLMESLTSCLAQTHASIEIVIGDDSSDNRTRNLIDTTYLHETRISYVKNEPSLGQADNIASLFERATGDKILLIHDDDALAPDCIERLLSLWNLYPDLEIAFGDQYQMDDNGHVDLEASRKLNTDYHRTEAVVGLQANPGRTGLIQMMPNNGWLANADLVKKISYRKQYGIGCEFVFGAQICIAARKVYYLKEYVSFYRKTDVSMSKTTARSTTAAAVLAYDFLKSLKLDSSLEPARELALKRIVPIVVSVYARNHQPMQALSIALAHLYAYNHGLSKRLYFHLMLILKGFASTGSYKSSTQNG